MAEMSLLQALHVRTKDKTHVCMTGHVIVYMIECVTSFKTSYSTKIRNVDVSYQTFLFPSHFIYSTRKAFLECTVIKFVNKFDEKSTAFVRKGKSTAKVPFKYFLNYIIMNI